MLVIDRRRQQAIVIDRDIRIVLLDTERNRAKFGLETVGTHEILREEQLGAVPRVVVEPVEFLVHERQYSAPEVRALLREAVTKYRIGTATR